MLFLPFSSKLCAGLVALLVSISLLPAAPGEPWPLGTITLNSNADPHAPPGYAIQGFTVSAPGVATSINGFMAIRHAANTPRGLLVAFTGGSGTGYWTSQMKEVYDLAEELRAEGFTIVQVRWATSWLESSPGNRAGAARLGARPATVIHYIHETYYRPLGLAPLHPGEAGFAVTGNSGGASQTSYALSHYGLDRIIDVAVPTGGPPHGALAKSCMNNPAEQAYWFELRSRESVDRGFGFFDGNGPAALHDASYIARWELASHSTGGTNYYHPRTRIHFILGQRDLQMQATAGDYHQRLKAEGTPYLAWEIAPDTPHATFGTPAGRAAIKAALLEKRPAILGVAHQNGRMMIRWSSLEGRSYQLQFKDELTEEPWQNIGAPVTASAKASSVAVETEGADKRFYRVLLLPSPFTR